MAKLNRVHFKSGSLTLEGILGLPEGNQPFPAVIVCHPHPLYGGSMGNNVVGAIFDALLKSSIAALKFNFRGVEGSEGEFDNGRGEQQDVAAALSYLAGQEGIDVACLGIAGYSAGVGYSLPVGCADPRIKAVAAVSPPLGMFDFNALSHCPKPKLLLSGSRDSFVPEHLFSDFARSLPLPREYQVIDGVDHFWWGFEKDLGRMIADFFARALKV